jgi:general secretion pathway protein A
MYYDFFGFREPPFSIAPDPRYLYLSVRHKEALAHLMYGVEGQGGFIVITGEVGTGKTTVCRCFIENAPEYVDIALILNPRLSARELLSAICDELAIAHEPEASIKILVDAINRDLLKAHAEGRHKVLIIDEAQNLSAEVLEQLRLLTNLETAEKKLLQIVLLGQPELQSVLALPELRQLNQRVTARYHLDAIDRSELPAYLQCRMSVAGLRGEVFTSGAIRYLYRASKGLPRLINLIADRALLGAYSEGDHQITGRHIRQAAKEVRGKADLPGKKSSARSGMAGQLVLLTASILVAVVGTLWLLERHDGSLLSLTQAVESQTDGVVERKPEWEPEPGAAEHSTVPFNLERHSLSLVQAFEALFDIWGKNYDPALAPVACDHALEVGLACLEQRGSRRSLAFLDRPAILMLRGDGGEPRYAVIRSLEGDRAILETRTGDTAVSFRELETWWFGNFRVLWQAPGYVQDGELYPDTVDQELWVGARMMQLAERLASSGDEVARVKALDTEQQVQWYQQKRGLTVDGILGARTIIQINNDLLTDVPKLSGGK